MGRGESNFPTATSTRATLGKEKWRDEGCSCLLEAMFIKGSSRTVSSMARESYTIKEEQGDPTMETGSIIRLKEKVF